MAFLFCSSSLAFIQSAKTAGGYSFPLSMEAGFPWVCCSKFMGAWMHWGSCPKGIPPPQHFANSEGGFPAGRPGLLALSVYAQVDPRGHRRTEQAARASFSLETSAVIFHLKYYFCYKICCSFYKYCNVLHFFVQEEVETGTWPR